MKEYIYLICEYIIIYWEYHLGAGVKILKLPRETGDFAYLQLKAQTIARKPYSSQ